MENTSQLEAVMSSLGYRHDDMYVKEPYCLENLREIVRFLRKEDKLCTVRQALGKANIVANDLVPIFTTYDDSTLTEIILRLLINLTQPVRDCFQSDFLLESEDKRHYTAVLWYLQQYKRDLANIKLWCTVGTSLGGLMQKSWFDRTIEDRRNMERWIFLIRNALLIGNDSMADHQRSNYGQNDHGKLIISMNKSGLFELILCLGQFSWSEDSKLKSFPHYVVEIVALMLKQQNPREMGEVGESTARSEILAQLVEEKEREKTMKAQKWNGRRHGSFGGVYVVPTGDTSVIALGSVRSDNLSFDKSKQTRRVKRKPLVFSEPTCEIQNTSSKPLKEFCLKFLTHCFPQLVCQIKNEWSQLTDERQTYWCWFISFFMSFSRIKHVGVGYVSKLLTVDSLKNVCGSITKHLESVNMSTRSNKQQVILASSRLHLSLHVFRELFENILEYSNDEQVGESMSLIKEHFFYSTESFDVLVSIFKKYSPSVMSRKLLSDLVETVELYVNMLEDYLKSKSHHFVKTAKKRRRPAKRRAAKSIIDWESVQNALVDVTKVEYEGPAVFDPVGDMTEEDQIMEAMELIKEYIFGRDFPQTVALLRHCQGIWPDKYCFGSTGEGVNDIVSSLRGIVENCITVDEEDEEFEDSDSSEEEYVHKEMSSNDYLLKLSCPVVISAYMSLLESYKANSDSANAAVIAMFKRIVDKLDLPGYLLQLRLFRIYQNITKETLVTKTKRFTNIMDFCGLIFKLFADKFAEIGPVLGVELLFWKTRGIAHNVTHGLFSYESAGNEAKSKRSAWTEEEDYELKQLFLELRGNSDHVIEDIMTKLIRNDRTKRKVVRRLIHLDLIQSSDELKSSEGKKSKDSDLMDWLLHIYCDGRKCVVDEVLEVIGNEIIQPEETTGIVRLDGTVDEITNKFMRFCGFTESVSGGNSTTFALENVDVLDLTNAVEAITDCQSQIIGWRTDEDRVDDQISVVAATEADLSEEDRFLGELDDVFIQSSTRVGGDQEFGDDGNFGLANDLYF